MWYRQSDGQAFRHTAFSWLSAVLIAAGIALRLWQFAGRSALWTDEARNRGSGAAARAGLAISVVPRTMRQAAIFVRIITAHPGSEEPRRIIVDAIEGIGRRNGRPSG